MTYPLPVQPGDPIKAIEYNKLVDAVKDFGRGGIGEPRLGDQVVVPIENKTGHNINTGDLVQLSSLLGTDESEPDDAIGESVYEAEDPTWHTAIDQIAVAAESIPSDERGIAIVWGHALVRTNAANNINSYLMVDPAQPSRARVTTGGFAKALYAVGTEYTMATVGDGANLWRFELNEDSNAPAATDAQLLNLADGLYAPSITLRDLEAVTQGLPAGTKGYCYNAANEFHVIGGASGAGQANRPWLKFVSTSKMQSIDNSMLATIDLVESGGTTNPATGNPWQPGEQITVYDPHNQWALAESGATGVAYWRAIELRWEIETCTLPVRYLHGFLVGTDNLIPTDTPQVWDVNIDPAQSLSGDPWSYPEVDPPPADETTGNIVAAYNDFALAAQSGSQVVLERVSNSQQQSNNTNLILGTNAPSTSEYWRIIKVYKPPAEWIRADIQSGAAGAVTGTFEKHWDGWQPTPIASITYRAEFDIPCPTKMVCHLDLNASTRTSWHYVPSFAPTAMLPAPEVEEYLVDELTASGTCGIAFTKRRGYLWNPSYPGPTGNCDEAKDPGSVQLATINVPVVFDITVDATGLEWTEGTVAVCGTSGGTTDKLPFAPCPPPDDPCGYSEYQWNAGTRNWDLIGHFCSANCSPDLANAPTPPANPDDDPLDKTTVYVVCLPD